MKSGFILAGIIFVCFISKGQKPFRMKDYKQRDTIYSNAKEINFLGSGNIVDDTLRFNRKYHYVVKNINRFVYKETTAEQKGENLNTERPEILKGIKLPAFINTKKIDPVREIASFQDSNDVCKCKDFQKIIAGTKELRVAYKTLSTNLKGIVSQVELFNSYSGVNRGFENLKENTAWSWKKIRDEKIKIVRDSLSLTLDSVDRAYLLSNFYKMIYQNTKLLLNDSIKPNADILVEKIDEEIKLKGKCLFDLSRQIRCLDTCKSKNFIEIEDKYIQLKQCIDKMKAFRDDLITDKAEIEKSLESMNSALIDGRIKNLQNNYNLLVAENFELELEPFKADKDIYEITFTAAAEGPLAFGKPTKRTIKVKAITSGGWKIDYSTGVFYNMGSNKFLGPEYYFENRASDTTKAVIEAQRTKKGMLSIGALMHVYPRINSVIRPGFAFGVSTTLGFDVLNFHGGVSILIGKPGKPNRVIISGGLTLREVSLLDSRFSLNEYRKDFGDAVPTSKNFPLSGGFISLTYNLTGINK